MAPIRKQREILDRNFRNLLMKFSPINKIRDFVLPAFEDDELTWSLVKKAIETYNLSTKISDVARLLLEYTQNFSTEELQLIYSKLLLYDVLLHHSKKMWTTVEMKQENREVPKSVEQCAYSMDRNFNKSGSHAIVYSQFKDGINWFVIIIKNISRTEGVVLRKPIYVAQFVNSPYLFYSPKVISASNLKLIASAFGYSDHKILKLIGKNINSLVSLLDRKRNANKIRQETSLALQEIEKIGAVRTSRGIDFCQNEIRSEQAKEILGNESIQLENLLINAETEWRGLRTLPEAKGNEMSISMELSSKNIRKSLEELIKRGIISSNPYPMWLRECTLSGKNVMKIVET